VEPGRVPDTIGLWREAAEGVVRRAGFYYQVVLKQTADLDDGRVLGQTPHPGESLGVGGIVVLEVARTPVLAGVTVPNLAGLSPDEAARALADLALSARLADGAGTAEQQGRIVSQRPAAGTDVAKQTQVTLVVARRVAAPTDGLSSAPAVGPGRGTPPGPPTPRSATTPLPPVRLPPRDAAPTASVPGVNGQTARAAVDAVIRAGLMPIVQMDRNARTSPGAVSGQRPAAGTPARLGDLVYLTVAVGSVAGERSVSIPVGTGAEAAQAQRVFAQHGLGVEVVEVNAPDHPYAGTGRVVAQYPVSTVPAAMGRVVTLWIVR
jgi:beta-lactam-binding protein with PASTA domain